MNNLVITSKLYEENGRTHGWYLQGEILRKNKNNDVESLYDCDSSLLSMLHLSSMHEYRKILQDGGATVVANNKTCFPTQESANAVIPKLTPLINENMLY